MTRDDDFSGDHNTGAEMVADRLEEALDRITLLESKLADVTLRLRIATECNVGDRRRIEVLEHALREACDTVEGWVQSETQHGDHEQDPDWIRAQAWRKLVGP